MAVHLLAQKDMSASSQRAAIIYIKIEESRTQITTKPPVGTDLGFGWLMGVWDDKVQCRN